MPELKFLVFDHPGKENTNATLELAKINADLLGINWIVIAATIWQHNYVCSFNKDCNVSKN